MKKVCLLLVMLLICSEAHATQWVKVPVFTNTRVGTVGETAQTTSSAINIGGGKRFGFWCTVSSVIATPSLKLIFEVANDLADKTWATPNTSILSATLSAEKPYMIDATFPVINYIRFKAISNGAAHNVGDAQITGWLYIQDY